MDFLLIIVHLILIFASQSYINSSYKKYSVYDIESKMTGFDATKKILEKHGFVHAKEASENSKIHFPEYMNKKIENTILRHMFPLNKIPPRYIEGWIVTLADKFVSCEVLFHPSFFKYLFEFRK